VNLTAAIEQGRYIPLDAADALSRLTVNDVPDPARCTKVVGDLIMGAAKGVRGATGRVVVCGEIAPTLLSKGNGEERLSSNACGTRSREAMGYRLRVAICRVGFHITKPTQSSKESAQNTQPFMDRN
jgi:hypothetical protein